MLKKDKLQAINIKEERINELNYFKKKSESLFQEMNSRKSLIEQSGEFLNEEDSELYVKSQNTTF